MHPAFRVTEDYLWEGGGLSVFQKNTEPRKRVRQRIGDTPV